MKQSKIDTIRTNLEANLEMMNRELDRLEEYDDDMYYTVRELEDRIFDVEHGYFDADEQVTYEQARKMYLEALEELDDAKGLRGIIQDEISALTIARRAVEKALDAMENI